MTNIFSMLKQASTMQSQMKKIQNELASKTVERTEEGVSVVVKGDMTVERVAIPADMLDRSKCDRLQKAVTKAVNSALGAAKDEAAAEMSKLAGDLGLGGLLGGMK